MYPLWLTGRRPSRAGGSAEARYRELRRRWRRHIGRRFALASAAVVIVVVLPGSVLLLNGGHRWAAGFLAGAAAGSLWALWQSPPGHVERWADGAAGERRTARVLRRLPPPWETVHDRTLGHGNLDHVVVGPAGVFVVDTKSWRGQIAVVDGKVEVRRVEAPDRVDTYDRVAAPLRATAAAVSRRVDMSDGRQPWVQPVVVFWGSFPQETVKTDGVAYVAGDHLTAWLLDRRPSLNAAEVAAVAAAITEALPPAPLTDGVPVSTS